MIQVAVVKLAPLEHWCRVCREYAMSNAPYIDRITGRPVRIYIDRVLRSDLCDGRAWILNQEDAEMNYVLSGVEQDCPPPQKVCEHLLEMD